MNVPARPRLLYFNGPWDFLGERMRRSFIEPFHALLAQDFEVISVEGDRDFAREVEQHRPDLVLFHSGCEAPREPAVTITNTDAYPELPRIGYIYRDPFSPSRLIAMNRLRTWGVHQVFTAFRPSDAPAPYFADTIYVPFWIDDALFRDYGETKDLPISLTGAGWLNQCIYLWRHGVFCQLMPRLPVFHAPSLGNRATNHDFTGERYARLLNRSQFSAGCGTANRYLTLKLLEIPAARACLVAEEIEVLKALGFRDGVNCVFATPENVAAKLQRLLAEPARLQAITDAGHRLVRENHTARNRRMFAEWFQLWQQRQPGQRIVQTNPLRPLELAPVDAPIRGTFPTENPIAEGLVAGYRLLAQQQWAEARAKFEGILAIIPCIAEARLGAAMALLRLALPAEAQAHLDYSLKLMVSHFGYAHPDPIDLAFAAVAAMRAKDPRRAVVLLASAPELRHPALNAMRWIFAKAMPALAQQAAFQICEGDVSVNTHTVHLLPQQTFREWVALLMAHLKSEPAGQKLPAAPTTSPARAFSPA